MLSFESRTIEARIILPDGATASRPVEIRVDPLSGRTSRITYSRSAEKEPGTDALPPPPPSAADAKNCPFCPENIDRCTPRLPSELCPEGRMQRGKAILFPNLFPYGQYSAVSLMDERHFVEIGTADPRTYADCFRNCRRYLERVRSADPAAVYMAITQNHLPSAGGSLVHPHLQVHADRTPPNHLRFLAQRTADYHTKTGRGLFSDYLAREREAGSRLIGQTGNWHWVAAFAPEGFFEIWGILPGVCSLFDLDADHRESLSEGVLNTQKFYRSLHRNGYNLGLLAVETDTSRLETVS